MTCHSVLFDVFSSSPFRRSSAQLNSLSSLLLVLRGAPFVVPGPPALLAAVLLPRERLALRLLLCAHVRLAVLDFENVFRRIIVVLHLAARRKGCRRRQAGHSKAVAAQVVTFALAVADLVAEDGVWMRGAAASLTHVPSGHLGPLHGCHLCVARAVLCTSSSIACAAPLLPVWRRRVSRRWLQPSISWRASCHLA